MPSEASLRTNTFRFIALLCKPKLENLHVQAGRNPRSGVYTKYIQILPTVLQYHVNFLAQAVGPKPRTNYSLCCGTSFQNEAASVWDNQKIDKNLSVQQIEKSSKAVNTTALSERGCWRCCPLSLQLMNLHRKNMGFTFPQSAATSISRLWLMNFMILPTGIELLLFKRKHSATFSNLLKAEASPFSSVAPPTTPTGVINSTWHL